MAPPMLEKVRKRVRDYARLFNYTITPEQEEEIVTLYELNYDEYDENALSLHIESCMQRISDHKETEWTRHRRKTVFARKVSTEHLELPNFEKSPETFNFLVSNLGTNIPFCLLSDDQKRFLVESMYPLIVEEGTVLIQEGDLGAEMYMIEEGELEVLVCGQLTNRLLPGSVFGELALLHGIPRTATVRAITRSKVWSAEQTSFSCIRIRDQMYRKKLVREVIETSPVFSSVPATPESVSRVVELSKSTFVKAGTPVSLENHEAAIVLKDARILDMFERCVCPRDVLRASFHPLTDLECVIINLRNIKS